MSSFSRRRSPLCNPTYLAALIVVAGEAWLFLSFPLLVYGGVAATFFHLFVIEYEESTLRRRFGEEYEEYRRSVPPLDPAATAAHVIMSHDRLAPATRAHSQVFAHAVVASGGCSSTRGRYSTSWMRSSKVRLSIISRATSG
jgi:hypothetical protein